jgi:hypothetical protein
MGSNASSVITDLTLSHMEYQFTSNKDNRRMASRLKNTVRYIDDLACFWSTALRECHQDIYPSSLPLNFAPPDNGHIQYLDLAIDLNTNAISVYDKRRDFDFEVLRLPEKSSNQPMTVGLNCFYSQLIRIARIVNNREDFLFNFCLLVTTMKQRGFGKLELTSTINRLKRNYPLLFQRCGIRKVKELAPHVEEIFD